MVSEHGGNIYANTGVIDFSANISPFGINEKVIRAVIDSSRKWSDYPDPHCIELIRKISQHECMDENRIVCGNGAADLIYRIAHAFKPQNAVICAPSFSEYQKALSEAECNIHNYTLYEENDFLIGTEITEFIKANSPDIVFICTPNNPTGKLIMPDVLKNIAELCLKKDILLVCDECFIDFVSDGDKYSLKNSFNYYCIILKAFTKFFAMPGLRLGYALCGSEQIANKLKNSGQYWSISTPAQAAGIAALDAYHDMDNRLTKEYISEVIKEERGYLTDNLSSLGIKVFSSDANYILLRSSLDLYGALLKKNILIRDCSNFSGLKKCFYRIAVKKHEDNVTLINAVKEVLNV